MSRVTHHCHGHNRDCLPPIQESQETHQQKKALNVVDEELASLKDSQKENAARTRELKATKSNIAKKGKSLKAQSNSSGKFAATSVTVSKSKRAEKASRVATIREGFYFFFFSITMTFKLTVLENDEPDKKMPKRQLASIISCTIDQI